MFVCFLLFFCFVFFNLILYIFQLFWYPTYNSVMLEQWMFLNKKSIMELEEYNDDASRRRDQKTRVYICTTMYREVMFVYINKWNTLQHIISRLLKLWTRFICVLIQVNRVRTVNCFRCYKLCTLFNYVNWDFLFFVLPLIYWLSAKT